MNLQRYAYYLYDPMDELMKPDEAGPYVLADEAEAEIARLREALRNIEETLEAFLTNDSDDPIEIAYTIATAALGGEE